MTPDDGGAGIGEQGSGDSTGSAPVAATAAPDGTPAQVAPVSGLPSDSGASILGEGKQEYAGVNYVGEDGNFVADWTTKLPEDFAPARDSLKNFRNINDLAKGYWATKQLVGKKGVSVPTAESSPEEVSAFRKATGVPDEVAGYAEAVKPKVVLPEGVQWNDDMAQQYFEVAHRNNIPASAMQELVQLDLKRREFERNAQNAEIIEKKQESLMQLRQTWGANFDRNIAIAQRAAATVNVSPNSFGFRDPEVVKGFVRLASMMGESQLVGANDSLPAGGTDLYERARDIMTNKENPLYAKYQSGDPEVQSRVRQYLIKSGR